MAGLNFWQIKQWQISKNSLYIRSYSLFLDASTQCVGFSWATSTFQHTTGDTGLGGNAEYSYEKTMFLSVPRSQNGFTVQQHSCPRHCGVMGAALATGQNETLADKTFTCGSSPAGNIQQTMTATTGVEFTQILVVFKNKSH